MKLKILGSSSEGNCYILENDKEALILEAGVSFGKVKKALDFNISKIVGVLVTHEHNDHAGHLQHFFNAGIPICASLGTLSAKGIDTSIVKPTAAEKTVKFGGFRVMPFEAVHDCAEPFSFLINHDECGNVLFATDTAEILYDFAGLNNILIEANYSDEIVYERIYNGKLNAKQHERTVNSHMSLKACNEFLQSTDLRQVNNIVLIHLSDGNSNAVQFRERVGLVTGKNTHVAESGMEIIFNKTPF